MKTSRALTIACTLAMSAAVVSPGSPAHAGSDPLCSFTPSTVTVSIDPSFFTPGEGGSTPVEELLALLPTNGGSSGNAEALENFEDFEDFFSVPNTTIEVDLDFPNDGSYFATLTLTVNGKTYGPLGGEGTEAFPAGTTQLASPELVLYFYLFGLNASNDPDFPQDFPNEDSWPQALTDPEFYPMSVRFHLESSEDADDGCSLTLQLKVGSGPTRLPAPCTGPYSNLCDYLEQRLVADSALPDTV